jgi:hypothetical protein
MIQGLLVVTPCRLVHIVELVMDVKVCMTVGMDRCWVLVKTVVNISGV